MSLFVVDVEASGPIPGDYSMLSFGAVRVDEELRTKYYSGDIWALPSAGVKEDAIVSIGLNLDTYQALHRHAGKDPQIVMESFETWISANNSKGRPIFVSDNNGFDWMFMCWYFHHFLGRNPFGFSSRRIGDLYCGLVKDMRASWKHLRKTKHTHHPVDDAKGNAEVILHMLNNMGLK